MNRERKRNMCALSAAEEELRGEKAGLLFDFKGDALKKERAYKRSEYFWFDSGTACFLAGIRSLADLADPRVKGRYLENYISQQILSWGSLQFEVPEIFYWEPKNEKGEVDFVIYSSGRGIGIEVKSKSELRFRDTRHMRSFMKTHPEISKGLIVYAGSKGYPVSTDIHAVSWYLL